MQGIRFVDLCKEDFAPHLTVEKMEYGTD